MYHIILCLASLVVGMLVASIADHIRFNRKQKYLGKLVLTEDSEDGQTYIFAKVESQETLDNLKEGEEVLFEIEHDTH